MNEKSLIITSGDTIIENEFLEIVMPLTNNIIDLKVYLLGFSYHTNKNNTVDNNYIAKILQIHTKDVYIAWDYWKSIGLVDFNEDYEEFRFIKIKDIIK